MEITYEKDNKERVPFEHYLGAYQKADPCEVCARTGARWLEDSSEFLLSFLGVEYAIRYPDFSVRSTQKTDRPFALTEISAARTLVIRFLTECCT
ncbi:MAG: hypothetical protein LUH00_11800, partial [Lachnospiraceae bacterium]|nr:hypothetical protein [Lachnospiraceae bacterium]